MNRRDVLRASGLWIAGASVAACAGANARASGSPGPETSSNFVSPTEDLMQEHGALRRLLMLFDEYARRIETATPLGPPGGLRHALEIMRDFSHGYHEPNEEQHIFPLADRIEALRETAATLRAQHAAGRAMNLHLIEETTEVALADSTRRAALAPRLRAVARMYMVHAAREDSVVFPAVRDQAPRQAWMEMGARQEEEEHRRLGAAGFEGVVVEVARIEQGLEIGDLARYTVRL